MSTDKRPRHIQQAEALRKLADAIEQDAEVAKLFDFPLAYMHSPLTSREDGRAAMERYARVLTAMGATVAIVNAADRCTVSAKLGPLGFEAWAHAHQMGGRAAPLPPPPPYEPLTPELLAEAEYWAANPLPRDLGSGGAE